MNAPRNAAGEAVALVDDAAGRHVAALLGPFVCDRAEVAISVRIVQRPVLRESLEIVAALDHVKRDVGAVAAAECVARAVEVEAPGVAAPFRKKLEPPRDRVVSPDALLKFGSADPRGDGASLGAVQPAVGAPGHRVDGGVGILKAEAGQEHLGVAVGPIIAVSIGIEEEIRGLADEDAAMTDRQAGGQVQAVDEDLLLVGTAVAIGVFEDLDPVGAPRAARRRVGHPVILGAKILVDRDRLQPRRVGILQVFDDPEPAALVEAGG